MTIETLASIHHDKGHPNPIKAALEDATRLEAEERSAAGQRPLPRATIERYYREGLSELVRRDLRAGERLREIEAEFGLTPELRAQVPAGKTANLRRSAIGVLAHELGVTPYEAERMLRRGSSPDFS